MSDHVARARSGPHVVAVSSSATHSFVKTGAPRITLLAGLGVEGDAHCGVTVKHRSRVAQDPTQPNLRQVHLIHHELFAELAAMGFTVAAGELGENVLTAGVALLDLPVDTELRLGAAAIVRLTGLRNPCTQLDGFQAGLMNALLEHTADGAIRRKAGVMGVVIAGGAVCIGDTIDIKLPAAPHRPLERV